MCSVVGLLSYPEDYEKFEAGFNKTKSRGPDDTRVIKAGDGLLGFHRLAIMDLESSGMQPFELGGNKLVCNGEIYG